MENFDIEIGRRIKIRRITLGISQKEMGEFIGVTFQQIQKYENGSNSFNAIKMIKICEFLKINPSWLLYGDDNDLNKQNDFFDKYTNSAIFLINSFPDERSKKVGIKLLKSIKIAFSE